MLNPEMICFQIDVDIFGSCFLSLSENCVQKCMNLRKIWGSQTPDPVNTYDINPRNRLSGQFRRIYASASLGGSLFSLFRPEMSGKCHITRKKWFFSQETLLFIFYTVKKVGDPRGESVLESRVISMESPWNLWNLPRIVRTVGILSESLQYLESRPNLWNLLLGQCV